MTHSTSTNLHVICALECSLYSVSLLRKVYALVQPHTMTFSCTRCCSHYHIHALSQRHSHWLIFHYSLVTHYRLQIVQIIFLRHPSFNMFLQNSIRSLILSRSDLFCPTCSSVQLRTINKESGSTASAPWRRNALWSASWSSAVLRKLSSWTA